MNLLSIGISHHTAPVDVRERMWFSDAQAKEALPRLREMFFTECLLVSTCNRTELYGMAVGTHPDVATVCDRLVEMRGARGAVGRDHFVIRTGPDAVRQLFKVASGTDSMVIGDIQILNQVKEAFQLARDANTLGPVMSRLMQAALHVGKRTRSETAIVEGAVSASYAAVELAGKIFADLSRRRALLVGAGETGELTLKHLVAKGIGQVRIANRTRERAEALAGALGGTVVGFEEILEALQDADIVITSVASPGHILEPAEIQRVMRRRGNAPLFIIDIGVPRNVHPDTGRIENVFLYDIDSLNQVVDRNLARREAEIPRVQAIIEEESGEFLKWYHSLQVGPAIQDLRAAFESVRQQEVEKNIHRFREEDRELVDLVTRRILNKLLHEPMTVLKKGSENGGADPETVNRIAALRDLFGISRRNGRDDGT